MDFNLINWYLSYLNVLKSVHFVTQFSLDELLSLNESVKDFLIFHDRFTRFRLMASLMLAKLFNLTSSVHNFISFSY